MAIFTMSDLHLSLDTDKSMEVFGNKWNNYIERINHNWNEAVSAEDTVLVGGDISWAMHLRDCRKDFEFLNSLPGRKLLFKGNHDYWWESMTKMKAFAEECGFNTLTFMQNDALICEDALICGTRGWTLPGDGGFGADDEKIYLREILRLELSLKQGKSLAEQEGFWPRKVICVLHYPPFTKDGTADEGFTSLMKTHNVTHCIYGHLHSLGTAAAVEGMVDGIDYRLVSGDYVDFMPVKL